MTDLDIIKRFDNVTRNLMCVNLEIIKKRDSFLLQIILNRTDFLPSGATLKERIFCIRNGIVERQACPVCKNGFLKFNRKTNSYSFGCNIVCIHKSDAFKAKMLNKYGTESPNSSPDVKALKASRMLAKYSVDNPSKIPEIQDKKIRTSIEKYGVRHWTNIEQARKTYREKTGYDNPSQNPDVKNKKIDTCLMNMGYDNPSKSNDVKEKKRRTCIENHGVEFGFMLDRHIVYNSISKLNKRVYAILDSNGIAYEKELRLYAAGTYRAYDIVFQNKKTILELNGDYWHANPKKFKAEDVLNLPHIGKVFAKSIWERDDDKKHIAESHGYRVYYLWEHEINTMTDDELLNWIRGKAGL